MADGPRILIAEDYPDIAEQLAAMFRHALGARTDIASDGGEAVRMWDEAGRDGGTYRLLIVDAAMPVKDGFTVAEYVRAADERVPILMITGKGGALARPHARRAGIDRVIDKPFEADEVLTCVEQFLATGRPGRSE